MTLTKHFTLEEGQRVSSLKRELWIVSSGSGWKPVLWVTVGKCVSICLRIMVTHTTAGWKPVPLWVMSGEWWWWAMSDERWVVSDERWVVSDEWWAMSCERWFISKKELKVCIFLFRFFLVFIIHFALRNSVRAKRKNELNVNTSDSCVIKGKK